MPFPEAFLEELGEKNPIEDVVGQYVSLTRRGSNLFGLCPFHNEKTPSFSVAPGKQMYYCFGCHKGGGVVNFIMEIEGLDYPDAVRFLAKRAGMEVPEDDPRAVSNYRRKERLWELCRAAARFYHETLKGPEGQEGLRYLQGRGLSAATITKFGLGFAPNRWDGLKKAMEQQGYSQQDLLDAGLLRAKTTAQKDENGNAVVSTYDWFRNRVMFPIIDVRGNVIGFGGRVMDHSEPKYLNSPESAIFNKRKNLFALNLAKKTKLDMLVLTEGYMDTISMHQYGFDCAVASLGTSLTAEQAGMLAKYTEKMVLCYDGDAAGQSAARRAIGILERTGMTVRVLRMRDAKDPDEYLKKFGPERFRKLLGESEDQIRYQLGSIQQKYDLKEPEGRVSYLQEAAQLIASLESAVQQDIYGAQAAEVAGVSAEAMKLEIGKARKRVQRIQKKKVREATYKVAAQYQPVDRSLRYGNLKSAVAEEHLLGQLFLEPALAAHTEGLTPKMFSAPLLGRAFSWIRERANGTVNLTVLGEHFSQEETAELSRIFQKETIVSEAVVQDCMATIEREYAKQDKDALLRSYRDKRKDGGQHE